MARFECLIAPVKIPENEITVFVEAKDEGEALVESFKQNPDTFVKSIRRVDDTEQ